MRYIRVNSKKNSNLLKLFYSECENFKYSISGNFEEGVIDLDQLNWLKKEGFLPNKYQPNLEIQSKGEFNDIDDRFIYIIDVLDINSLIYLQSFEEDSWFFSYDEGNVDIRSILFKKQFSYFDNANFDFFSLFTSTKKFLYKDFFFNDSYLEDTYILGFETESSIKEFKNKLIDEGFDGIDLKLDFIDLKKTLRGNVFYDISIEEINEILKS